jgi:hypothetical protein
VLFISLFSLCASRFLTLFCATRTERSEGAEQNSYFKKRSVVVRLLTLYFVILFVLVWLVWYLFFILFCFCCLFFGVDSVFMLV